MVAQPELGRWLRAIDETNDPAERAEFAAAVARWATAGKLTAPRDPALAMPEMLKERFYQEHGREPSALELVRLLGRVPQRRQQP